MSHVPLCGTPEELERLAGLATKHAEAVLAHLPALGMVTWLMMQSPAHRHQFIADCEWRVMPPLLLGQFKLYMKGDTPLAFVSWARLSPQAALRFRAPPHHLGPADWKSGDEPWLVDVLTPFGGTRELMADLQQSVLPGRPLCQLAPGTNALANVMRWPPVQRVH